jgi:predicted TIM-barrel fold metal-dependent hydrolase
LAERIPYNAWDSHMHVIDPENYPLHPDAVYTPTPYSLSDAIKFEQAVGIRNIVLVQPSIYGNDNSCMLDALRELGPYRGRGVAMPKSSLRHCKSGILWEFEVSE